MTTKDFFLFIYKDFKDTLIAIKEIFTGERRADLSALKGIGLQTFTDNWMWFLLLILAFCMGILLGAAYYEVQAHNFILANCGCNNPYDLLPINLTLV